MPLNYDEWLLLANEMGGWGKDTLSTRKENWLTWMADRPMIFGPAPELFVKHALGMATMPEVLPSPARNPVDDITWDEDDAAHP